MVVCKQLADGLGEKPGALLGLIHPTPHTSHLAAFSAPGISECWLHGMRDDSYALREILSSMETAELADIFRSTRRDAGDYIPAPQMFCAESLGKK